MTITAPPAINHPAILSGMLAWRMRQLAGRLVASLPVFLRPKGISRPILPCMSGLEYAFFRALARRRKDCIYLEYGCGGSTLLADGCFARIHSSDTDKRWCGQINSRLKHGMVCHVDVGETGEWGAPRDMSEQNARKIAQVHQNVLAEAESGNPGKFILIDGRCRVLTACAIFPHVTDGDIVLVHDFTTRREYYDMLQMYDLSLVYGSLALLTKNHSPESQLACQQLAHAHRCDFR